MPKLTYTISKEQFEKIYNHSYNIYSAIEEMYNDFAILHNTLEQIKESPNNKNPKVTHIYKKKFE